MRQRAARPLVFAEAHEGLWEVNEVVLLDTGPLVALLNGWDRQHDWAKDQFVRLRPPLLSCEAVLSETLFLLRDLRLGAIETMRLVEKGMLRLPFKLEEVVLTFDSDFDIYRRHRRQVIPTIRPKKR